MSWDTYLGVATFFAVTLVIFGLSRGFPWFIIKGALVNGPGLVAALWGIMAGVSKGVSEGGGWWLLAVVGVIFAYVCGHNVKHYLDGSEAKRFYDLVRAKLGEGQNGGRRKLMSNLFSQC